MSQQRMIVGEVTKTYAQTGSAETALAQTNQAMGTLGKRFEAMLDANACRGYVLRDWQYTSIVIPRGQSIVMPTGEPVNEDNFEQAIKLSDVHVTETIIAVFQLMQAAPR